MSSNLRNKQYYFKNEQLTREEYQKRMAEFKSGSFEEIEKGIKDFEELNLKAVKKNLNIINSLNSTGDNIIDSKNIHLSFGLKDCENCRFCWDVMRDKECVDIYSGGDSELSYDGTAIGKSYNSKFSIRTAICRDADYSIFVRNCKSLFACIGLRNKEYCIFNKQYTKEEYEALREKIVKHMNETGEYGEFFPMEISMFAYNETIAQEYYPLKKGEVLANGLRWQEPDTKSYKVSLEHGKIPDDIKYVSEEILKEVISCTHAGTCSHGCTTAFKIIPRELEFYKRMNLALPRLCPNCRHYGRLAKYNPLKLWPGKCACGGEESDNGIYKNLAKHPLHGEGHCPNEFQTSYAPDRPEIVYCEKCYQQEIA